MKTFIFILNIIALLSGLFGSGLIFKYGLPSKIESETHSQIVTEQAPDEANQIKIKNKKIKNRESLGISLIFLCFLIQEDNQLEPKP